MTVQDMIDEINDHGFTDTSVIRKVALINDTLWDICSREAWPFLEKTMTLNFDGTNPYPSNFPTDFRAVMSLVRMDTGNPLDPERYDVMERKYGNQLTSTGQPMVYYFLGNNQLRVYNVPAAASAVLRLDYICNHPTVAQNTVEAGILLPPQHHRVVLLGALYKLYDMDDDFDIGASFQAQYEDRIIKMRNQLWQRQFDRPDRIFGIDDFDLQFLS